MAPVLDAGQEGFLFNLAGRITPECAGLDEKGRRRFLEIVNEALASRPPLLRRQFRLFLAVLRWSSLPRYFAPLDALPGEKQDAVLRWFENAPLTLLRQGFWGLKAMVFMGYYGRPEAGAALGYLPSKKGNEVLHERTRV